MYSGEDVAVEKLELIVIQLAKQLLTQQAEYRLKMILFTRAFCDNCSAPQSYVYVWSYSMYICVQKLLPATMYHNHCCSLFCFVSHFTLVFIHVSCDTMHFKLHYKACFLHDQLSCIVRPHKVNCLFLVWPCFKINQVTRFLF